MTGDAARAPQRVLHVIDTGGPGGAETVLDTIVGRLPSERWRSRVVVPVDDWLAGRLRQRGIETAIVPTVGSADVRFLAALVRELRGFGPDIVHAHLLGAGVYSTLASTLTSRVPVVCTLHGRPDVSPSDPLLSLKARILTGHRNRIVYVSHDLRAHLEPRLGVGPRSGLVIHNGVEIRTPRLKGTERTECGAGPDDLLVGAVGNVRPAKDYENLMRAASLVCEARDDVRFVVAGDQRSPLTDPLLNMVESLGLTDRVRFLGFRTDVPELVASFDLFVSSSHTEGLPLGTVEAMALGTPVVLTRVGGVPEVVQSGSTGLLVPPRNPEALARGILESLTARGRARSMAQEGSRDVQVRFGADRMAADYQRLYRRLIASR